MKFSAFDLVMFDLDGTLIDTLPDIVEALDGAFGSHGLPAPGMERARLWVGNGSKRLLRRALAVHLECEEAEVPAALYDDVEAAFFDNYASSSHRQGALYPGVQKTLAHLEASGTPMAVVTNKPGRFTGSVLGAYGIAAHFSLVLSGDSLAACKPDPEPLHHVMRVLDCEPQRALMIGDSRNDVLAARAAMVPVVCVDYGYNYGESVHDLDANMVVGDISTLIENG